MSTYFDIPERWEMPDHVWARSMADMAIDGRQECEGVAMWLGRHDGPAARISRVVLLRGRGVLKRHDQLAISAELMNDVADVALELGLVLIGQIHSHSPLASTDLSWPDRYLGLDSPGYLSLVAPDFAQRAATRLEDCGVHVHEAQAGWRRLSIGEIGRRFERTSGPELAPIVVGV